MQSEGDVSDGTSFNDDAISIATNPEPLDEKIGASTGAGDNSDSFEPLLLPSPSSSNGCLDFAVSSLLSGSNSASESVLHSSAIENMDERLVVPIKRGKRKNETDMEARSEKEAKKREREQLASQKIAEKQQKQNDRKAEQERKKRQKAIELEVKRFEREKNSATSKSKCESSFTTVIDSGVFAMIGDEFRGILEATFAVKSLSQQLKEESQIVPDSVVWRRRIIEGRLVDRPGTSEQVLERSDYEETQDQVVVIITSARFAEMVKRKFTTSEQEERLLDFIERIKSLTLMSGDDKKLTIAIFGTSFSGLRRDTILNAVLDLQMDAKVQPRMVETAQDVARLLLNMHRAVANAEHKQRRNQQSNFVMDKHSRCIKGVRPVGQGDAELIRDWWGKMLMRIPRVTEEEMETVVSAHPCPFHLMLEYERIERQDVRERLLANLQVVRGAGRIEVQRRLGPSLSKKICLMLTSRDGDQLVT